MTIDSNALDDAYCSVVYTALVDAPVDVFTLFTVNLLKSLGTFFITFYYLYYPKEATA